jgi:putative colanic acid biosynthesis acetyltransferase WcaF
MSAQPGRRRFPLVTHQQDTQFSSPWSLRGRIRMLAWQITWGLLCRWTPKPLNRWRVFWLRAFGARIHGRPFVHQSARIAIPWHLTLHDHACLGDGANAYTLGEIEIMENATVAQEAYLCTGTHLFTHPAMPLQTGKILIGRRAFVGARSFVMPGVEIGAGAVIGAASVVTSDVPARAVVCGNPGRVLRVLDDQLTP